MVDLPLIQYLEDGHLCMPLKGLRMRKPPLLWNMTVLELPDVRIEVNWWDIGMDEDEDDDMWLPASDCWNALNGDVQVELCDEDAPETQELRARSRLDETLSSRPRDTFFAKPRPFPANDRIRLLCGGQRVEGDKRWCKYGGFRNPRCQTVAREFAVGPAWYAKHHPGYKYDKWEL